MGKEGLISSQLGTAKLDNLTCTHPAEHSSWIDHDGVEPSTAKGDQV